MSRRIARGLAISCLIIAAACGGGGSSDAPAQATPPFLQSPFSGTYPTASLFDHDIPKQFIDTNGSVVDHTGTRRAVGQPGAAVDGHQGHDWLMPVGTQLVSASDGAVRVAGDTAPYACPVLPGSPLVSNKEVMVEYTANGERFLIRYVHLSSVSVTIGSSVSAGTPIGESGNTGCSTAPHLHFQVYRLVTRSTGAQEWVDVDPYGWSAASPDPWAQHPEGATSTFLWKAGQTPALVLQ